MSKHISCCNFCKRDSECLFICNDCIFIIDDQNAKIIALQKEKAWTIFALNRYTKIMGHSTPRLIVESLTLECRFEDWHSSSEIKSFNEYFEKYKEGK